MAPLEKQIIDDVSSKAENENWTDVKHSERMKREKILPNGVVLGLMKKSDWEGFKRMSSNLTLLFMTAYAIREFDIFQYWNQPSLTLLAEKMLVFVPLYIFYGFQMQCFAFAGGHELLHGNAFKTKWINSLATFFVSTAFFEVLYHERLNHKQHHKFTLDIDRDPELTSFYSREELENTKFMSVPDSKSSYFMAFINVISYFQHRSCRLLSSCMGIATDYTGLGWSMKSPKREEISRSVIREMQVWSILQFSVYVVVFATLGNTIEGVKSLLFWWIAPCIIGYGPINFFRNAEHANCDITNNQLLNTRTVESNRFFRWLLWETNFHCEHHAYPMVPFYNLPKLHELLNDHIKHNDCKSFITQNWKMIKSGGWIDQQNSKTVKSE